MSHPAFFTRLRVVLGLLLGLRLRDLQSARRFKALRYRCLLYTSDAADDLL